MQLAGCEVSAVEQVNGIADLREIRNWLSYRQQDFWDILHLVKIYMLMVLY